MARKNKRKKTKKAHKQKSTKPNIKISEAILRLCEPLRKRYRKPHEIEMIISWTVMAWNISLVPKEEQIHAQEIILDALPEQLSGEDVALLLDNIDKLIERKERNYPHVREYILNRQLSFSGDTITLTVATSTMLEKFLRKERSDLN